MKLEIWVDDSDKKVATSLQNIGKGLFYMKKYDEALNYSQRAVEIEKNHQ